MVVLEYDRFEDRVGKSSRKIQITASVPQNAGFNSLKSKINKPQSKADQLLFKKSLNISVQFLLAANQAPKIMITKAKTKIG